MIRKEYNSDKFQFPFVMYTPNEMKDNLPIIIQLHGAGEVGFGKEDLSKVDIHGFSKMIMNGEEYPCAFVLPQCRPESFWVVEINNLHDFIINLQKEFNFDVNRTYLTGLSMGGYGTWYTSLRYPDLFAAIAPVCGGGMVWKAGALNMPVWAFHGTEDGVVYPSESLNMINKIRAEGQNKNEVKLTILDGVGHNAWEKSYTKELFNWLCSKSKSENL